MPCPYAAVFRPGLRFLIGYGRSPSFLRRRDTHIPRPRGGGTAGAIPAYPGAPHGRGSAAYLHTPARRVGVEVEAPHTYIPPQGPRGPREQTPKKRQSGLPWPIPSLVSWALVRRRQRWRPLLRRRAELFGRPHGERCCGVAERWHSEADDGSGMFLKTYAAAKRAICIPTYPRRAGRREACG